MQTLGKSKLGKTYGYRPPSEDHHMLKAAPIWGLSRALLTPPPSVDLRPTLRPIRNQGNEGSCFAHAAAAHKEANCVKWAMERGGPPTPLGAYLSVAYLSWRTRLAMGTFPDDSGASIADVMAVLQAWGVCPEDFLPYNQSPAEAGNAACDLAATPYRVATPCIVHPDANSFKQVLTAGHTIVVGFSVFQSFEETGLDGLTPMAFGDEPLLGGHAVLITGYRDDGRWIVRNSWGDGWGKDGYCFWPEAYLGNCWEAWTTA